METDARHSSESLCDSHMNIAETIKFLETSRDVEAQMEAFKKLNASVTESDLPVLLKAIKSETSNFWVRELLSEPIINLAGAKALPELMAALQKNFDEGHDNDGFLLFLTELAEEDPRAFERRLKRWQKQQPRLNWRISIGYSSIVSNVA